MIIGFVVRKRALVEVCKDRAKKMCDFRFVIKKNHFNFPLVFELLIWLIYVCIYKYSYHLDEAALPHIKDNDFPYLQILLFGISSSLYLIPYYRWLVPQFLLKKKYLLLFFITLFWFLLLGRYSNYGVAWVFSKLTSGALQGYFIFQYKVVFLDFNLTMTDFMAFFSISLCRYSYQSEQHRNKIETDNLKLQLQMLKAQLQPHFLFNTLNSLYGMSLSGSKDTSRFILLLSQMMQYILYDCDGEEVSIKEEVSFLKGYFELEQKRYPKANINLHISDSFADFKLPPLLFLPLVENAFKHGKYRLEDEAIVAGELLISANQLVFKIVNDRLDTVSLMPGKERGGLGLPNIKKRLALYYGDNFDLSLQETKHQYIAILTIKR